MRSKAKYMAIVAIVVVAILAITLVSCGGGGKVAEETTNWLASAKKATVTDTITLSDVKLDMSAGMLAGTTGNVISIGSLDIEATRVIEGDKLGLTLKVKNIKDITFGDGIDSLLDTVGSLLKNINIKNIGNIEFVEIKLNYDPSAETVLTGQFNGRGLNAFITDLPAGDTNPNGEKFLNVKADEVSGKDHKREEKLIAGIVDLLDNPIYGPSTFDKKGNATSNVANIIALAKLALEEYGEDKFWDSNGNKTQYDAKSIVNMIFGAGKADSIADVFTQVLEITSLKLANSETQKVDGKNVYSKTELTANVDVKLSNQVILNIANNIGTILGAFGVELPGIVTNIIPQVLQGNVALEAGVKVSTTYVNG